MLSRTPLLIAVASPAACSRSATFPIRPPRGQLT